MKHSTTYKVTPQDKKDICFDVARKVPKALTSMYVDLNMAAGMKWVEDELDEALTTLATEVLDTKQY
jgi:predicted thioesterase